MSIGECDPFVGRRADVTALRAVLAEVRSGRPRVVVINGPPGIGKTALIEHVLSGEVDLTVLRATGEQWEAFVAYGIIDQLMRGAGFSSARLLASRERSLLPDEPVGVGARILEVLQDLEEKAPLVVVVDDAHWADTDSLRALLFAVRRLVGERVLTLLAVRTEDAGRLPEGLLRLAAGRTGSTVHLEPLVAAEVQRLATALGISQFPVRAAQRLHAHTEGNPLYAKTLLAAVPEDRWRTWEPVLPAPSAFAAQVRRRLDACDAPARHLVEAAAVLGATSPVASVASLAGVEDVVSAVDEAGVAGLLQSGGGGIRELAFPHPLVRAAVYEQLRPTQRVQLHAAAAQLVEDEGAALRHRVMAATPPAPALAAELDEFARREAALGGWASAASALVEASRLSSSSEQREQRLLQAVDATVGAGDLIQADAFAREVVAFAPGPLRDAALGYLAVLRARPGEAEKLLSSGWRQCDAAVDASLAAVIAQRWALHSVGRLRGAEVVTWARRAIELAGPGDPVRVEAEALLGLGLGWSGRMPEGLAAYEAVLVRLDGRGRAPADRVRMAHSWLQLVADDVVRARDTLADTAPAALRAGSVRIAVWSHVWLARADYALGAWDEAAAAAERAVSLLEESGHEWLRPLARLSAVLVPAARGEWWAAEEHARAGSTRGGDYELMVVASGMAGAHLATARGDHDAVLRALEPVVRIEAREGVDEPGFWPWQDLYGDALLSAGRLEEAEVFLRPHEELAAVRGRASMIARLARVRGRLEAARGRADSAEEAFGRGLAAVRELSMPFERALLEMAHGQVLRRGGQRRAAAGQLQAARERLVALRARPYLERCERELSACGLVPAKRRGFDPSRLTAQESAVARLVALGMSNRQVASELFVSVKTVQFHLTHIYAKLGISSRAELAAQFKDTAT